MRAAQPQRSPKNRTGILLVLVVSLLAIHLVAGLATRNFVVRTDGSEYYIMAQHLLDSGHFTYDGQHPVVGKPPGFPAFIAGYLSLVGSLSGFAFVQLLMLFGAYLFTGAIAARFVGRSWALAVLGFLVCVDPLRDLAFNLHTEPLFLLLTMSGLWLILRTHDTGGWQRAILAGAIFGLSSYVRPINLFWPLLLFCAVWIVDRRRRPLALWILAAHMVVVTPWIVRNAVQFGRMVPMVANWGPLYYATDEELWQIYFFDGSGVIRQSEDYQEITRGEFQFNWGPNVRFREMGLANIRSDPAGYLRRCSRQLLFAWTYVPGTKALRLTAPRLFFTGRVIMLLFWIVSGVGAWTVLRSQRPASRVLIGYAVYTALILFPVTTESRYLIPAYLAVLPLTFMGLQRLRTGGFRSSVTVQAEETDNDDDSATTKFLGNSSPKG